jgi:hypothetical protein
MKTINRYAQEAGPRLSPTLSQPPEPLADPASWNHELDLDQALRIKSAEYWLKLGEPVEAMMELGTLSDSARGHSWPCKVHLAAMHATGE